jgi:hypothetical protein
LLNTFASVAPTILGTTPANTSSSSSLSSRPLSSSLEHHRHTSSTPIPNNSVTTAAPAFLSPSAAAVAAAAAAFPIDLRSFYPLLPCWQYPAWTFQTPASLLSSQPGCLIQPSSALPPPPIVHHKTTTTRHRTTTTTHTDIKQKKITTTATAASINSNTTSNNHSKQSILGLIEQQQQQQPPISPKKEALTFHLHTHHHHHIHNPNPTAAAVISSNTSSLLKSPNQTKTTTVPLSPQKSCVLVNREQLVETKTILPLSVNNVVKREHHQQVAPFFSLSSPPQSPIIENEALNFSIKHLSAASKKIWW